MAKRRKKYSGRKKKSMSIVGTGSVIAGVGIGLLEGWEQTKTVKGALVQCVYRLSGVDVPNGKWVPKDATGGMIILGGAAVSMAGKKVGANRYIPLPKGITAF